MYIIKKVLLLIFIAAISVNAEEIKLPRFITDGMVIQRETNVPLWGWTTPGSTVDVTNSWNDEVVRVVANQSGKFISHLNSPVAGGPYSITFKVNGTEKVLTDILSGEVWLASGQSNMKMRLGEADMWRVQNDNNPNIRVFEVSVARSNQLQDTVKGGVWRNGVVPNNMQHITAVGYYFARRLQEKLGVPVGILGAYEGGTNIEEWTSPAVMSTMPDVSAAYNPAAGKEAGCLYNAMINPLLPYKIAGVIWYQGENNVSRIQHYEKNNNAMVAGWREDFRIPTLPFYFVQLTSFSSSWMAFREMQEGILKTLKNSGMVVTIDVGDVGDIHPKNKKPVGDRLGNLALAKVYGKTENSFSSPLFRKAVQEGVGMRVYFDFADQGLQMTNGEQVNLFEIAGSDGVYQTANARIEGNTVFVWNDAVSQPVAVRYYWKNHAVPNLFSKDGLPVAPFRSIK